MCSLLKVTLHSFSVSQIEMITREHRVSGQILKKLHEDIQSPISAILTLNTLASTGGSTIAGAAFVEVFPQTSETCFTIAISFGVLVFPEIIPTTAGVVHARSLASLIAYPIHWLVWIFSPLIWPNNFTTQFITRGGQAQ